MFKDGDLTCYVIERFFPNYNGHDQWLAPSDSLTRRATDEHRTAQHTAACDSFDACGMVWQNYGIYGVKDEALALQIIPLLRKHYPQESYRLVRLRITQSREVLCTIEADKVIA